MTTISVCVPVNAKVVGKLQSHPSAQELSQDIYQVELPGEIFVHVGWLPEFDQSGEYLVSVFRVTLDDPLQRTVRTSNVEEVKRVVESAVSRFAVVKPPLVWVNPKSKTRLSLGMSEGTNTTSILQLNGA